MTAAPWRRVVSGAVQGSTTGPAWGEEEGRMVLPTQGGSFPTFGPYSYHIHKYIHIHIPTNTHKKNTKEGRI